jgi:transposase
MLARVDAIDTDLATLDTTIEQMAAPFTAAIRRLAEIPGISITAACAILAEIGTDSSPGLAGGAAGGSRRHSRRVGRVGRVNEIFRHPPPAGLQPGAG